jgi:hypothetical protein
MQRSCCRSPCASAHGSQPVRGAYEVEYSSFISRRAIPASTERIVDTAIAEDDERAMTQKAGHVQRVIMCIHGRLAGRRTGRA